MFSKGQLEKNDEAGVCREFVRRPLGILSE